MSTTLPALARLPACGGIAPALRGGAMSIALSAAMLCACAQVDVVVVPLPVDAAMDSSMAMDAAEAGADAEMEAGPADTGVDADSGDGMVVVPDDDCPYRTAPAPGSTAAVRDVVARGLERAICACTFYSGSAGLTVDRLDGTAGGDVGVNEEFDVQLSATLAIGGELIAAGVGGLGLGQNVQLTVGSDLSVGGPLEGAEASVAVAGDARVAGRIDLIDLEVIGALRQTPGETLQVVNPPRLGELINEAVAVEPPCVCDPAEQLDVVTLVGQAAMSATPLELGTIPEERCGEYVLDGGSVDTFTLVVSDSAALYVLGDLHLDALTIDVAPDAELDLFLEGTLFATGPVEVGSAAGGLVRIHVGGMGTIDLQQGGSLHGALYAPNSELVLSGALDVRGALLVRRVAAFASVVVHFDPRASEP